MKYHLHVLQLGDVNYFLLLRIGYWCFLSLDHGSRYSLQLAYSCSLSLAHGHQSFLSFSCTSSATITNYFISSFPISCFYVPSFITTRHVYTPGNRYTSPCTSVLPLLSHLLCTFPQQHVAMWSVLVTTLIFYDRIIEIQWKLIWVPSGRKQLWVGDSPVCKSWEQKKILHH